MQPSPGLHHTGEAQRQIGEPPPISRLEEEGVEGLALEVEGENAQALRLEVDGVGTADDLGGLPVGIRHILGILAEHPGQDEAGDEIDNGMEGQLTHEVIDILILGEFQDVGKDAVPNNVEHPHEPLDRRHPPGRRSGHLDGPLDQVEPGDRQLVRPQVVPKVEDLVRGVDEIIKEDALLVRAVHHEQIERDGEKGTAEVSQVQDDEAARRRVPLELIVLRDELPHGAGGHLVEDEQRKQDGEGAKGVDQGISPVRIAVAAPLHERIVHLPIVEDGRLGKHGLGGIADAPAVVRELRVEAAFHHGGAGEARVGDASYRVEGNAVPAPGKSELVKDAPKDDGAEEKAEDEEGIPLALRTGFTKLREVAHGSVFMGVVVEKVGWGWLQGSEDLARLNLTLDQQIISRMTSFKFENDDSTSTDRTPTFFLEEDLTSRVDNTLR